MLRSGARIGTGSVLFNHVRMKAAIWLLVATTGETRQAKLPKKREFYLSAKASKCHTLRVWHLDKKTKFPAGVQAG